MTTSPLTHAEAELADFAKLIQPFQQFIVTASEVLAEAQAGYTPGEPASERTASEALVHLRTLFTLTTNSPDWMQMPRHFNEFYNNLNSRASQLAQAATASEQAIAQIEAKAQAKATAEAAAIAAEAQRQADYDRETESLRRRLNLPA